MTVPPVVPETPNKPLLPQIRPVIIAGAGPCGLVAALTLQQQNVPFIVYERASRAKLCANTGSGIDMAPTAVKILAEHLHLELSTAMRPYECMYIGALREKKTTNQKKKTNALVTYQFQDLPLAQDFGFSNRAELQKALLAALTHGVSAAGVPASHRPEDEAAGVADDELLLSSIVRCNTEIVAYEQPTNDADPIIVTLQTRDPTTGVKTESHVEGSALLACDGIHSAIRNHMHRHSTIPDALHDLHQVVWWGKTEIVPGTELDLALQQLQHDEQLTGALALTFLGTPSQPGCFFTCAVSATTQAWVYFTKQNQYTNGEMVANASNDLVRRGGTVLDEAMKHQDLLAPFVSTTKASTMHPIVELFFRDTVATDITRAGFYDRQQLQLPYVDGRVALLGDAAHPQSPIMGQGANMAIVDGYVVGTRLAAAYAAAVAAVDTTPAAAAADFAAGVRTALLAYDCPVRKRGVNKVIKEARTIGKWAVSQNRFKAWCFRAVTTYSPPALVVQQLVYGDHTNRKFVSAMERDLQKKKTTTKKPSTSPLLKSDHETASSMSS